MLKIVATFTPSFAQRKVSLQWHVFTQSCSMICTIKYIFSVLFASVHLNTNSTFITWGRESFFAPENYNSDISVNWLQRNFVQQWKGKTGNINRIVMWCFTKYFLTAECQKPLTSIWSKNPETSFLKLQPFWFVRKKMNPAWHDGPWPQLKIEFTCGNKGRNTQCDPRFSVIQWVQTHPLDHQDAAQNQTVLNNYFLQNIATFLLPHHFQVMMRFPVKWWWIVTWTKGFYLWIKVPWNRSCTQTWDCQRRTVCPNTIEMTLKYPKPCTREHDSLRGI